MGHIKYTKELLEDAVAKSFSIAGVLRQLGLRQAGGTQSYIGAKLKKLNIDTSHFTGQGHNKGKKSNNRKNADEILIKLPCNSIRTKTQHLVRALIETGVPYECSFPSCSIKDTWNGSKLVLHVDHIDGNILNNVKSNLRFLCPNCHSQTITYCRNKSKLAELAK